jgi:uncharacterized membrane protein YhaH (DUF805 family)
MEGHMNFTEAIQSGFRNYVNFKGRAARSEYWYWALFYVIVVIVTSLIDLAIAGYGSIQPLTTLAELALLLPTVALGVRRLHDTDRSGWWLLLSFIPVIGWIILIIWYCSRGTIGANRFGPDPLGGV